MSSEHTSPPSEKSRGRGRVWVVLAIFLGLGLTTLGGLVVLRDRYFDRTVGPIAEENTFFEIERGDAFSVVATKLERDGWIPWALPLRIEARVQGWDRRVFPGYYLFREGETIASLALRLASGEIEQAKVTIPEGLRLAQVLPVLAEATRNDLAELERIAADPAFLDAERIPGPGLDGYFFPETYHIAIGESPERVLQQVVRPGVQLYEEHLEGPADALGLSQAEVWSLAAMIEAEAVLAEERSRISAVFWNRLRRGMRLESDPTVLFALGRPPGRVLYRDLEVESPYNTYRVTGLPPGPICAPGRASLIAAVHPTEGVEDLFFVARGDGSHVFSKTLAAHNRAKREVRRKK